MPVVDVVAPQLEDAREFDERGSRLGAHGSNCLVGRHYASSDVYPDIVRVMPFPPEGDDRSDQVENEWRLFDRVKVYEGAYVVPLEEQVSPMVVTVGPPARQ